MLAMPSHIEAAGNIKDVKPATGFIFVRPW